MQINMVRLLNYHNKYMDRMQDINQEEDICRKYEMNNDSDFESYQWIMIMRIIIICISATALIINIVVIIKKKQYKFNTIRLFLFVQILYAASLLSVVSHNSQFNLKQTEKPNDPTKQTDQFTERYMKCFVASGEEYKCAVQGFVNLACYSMSYWFAVCITLYIKAVLQNNHKKFMKKKGPLIFAVIAIIIIWYLIPFILTFIKDMQFSFGPTGYWFKGHYHFFYAGIVNRQDTPTSKSLVAFWMLILPVSLFIYHINLLFRNQRYINKLKQLDEINPRQWFLIRSGKLSFLIFLVQILNVGKLILSFFCEDDTDALNWVVFIINTAFDLLALGLVWMYSKLYYREGRNLQQKSEIMNSSLASSFATLSSSII